MFLHILADKKVDKSRRIAAQLAVVASLGAIDWSSRSREAQSTMGHCLGNVAPQQEYVYMTRVSVLVGVPVKLYMKVWD